MRDTNDGPYCDVCRKGLAQFLYELVELNPHPRVDDLGVPATDGLIPFWITPHDPHGPIGLGVTGYSLDDACSIVKKAGYDVPTGSDVIANVRNADLDPSNVARRAGPIAVRGLWYPFVKLGI